MEDSVTHVMGSRKNSVHEGVSVTCRVLFVYYFQVRTSCMQLWLQFVAKENAMFCGYHRCFSKDKSSFGSQTGNNGFLQRDKRKTHDRNEAHFIVKN